MNLLEYIFSLSARKPKHSTADIARERLKIVVAHQVNSNYTDGEKSDYIASLQEAIIKAVSQFINIDDDQIFVNIERKDSDGDQVLELNVTVPEKHEQAQTG